MCGCGFRRPHAHGNRGQRTANRPQVLKDEGSARLYMRIAEWRLHHLRPATAVGFRPRYQRWQGDQSGVYAMPDPARQGLEAAVRKPDCHGRPTRRVMGAQCEPRPLSLCLIPGVQSQAPAGLFHCKQQRIYKALPRIESQTSAPGRLSKWNGPPAAAHRYSVS
jgi:hypothetical protein